jgi:Family of unknown function (DUF5313)
LSTRSVKAWEIAAEALGLAFAPRVRPNPALWLWYVYWGPLPKRHAIWVLYDATCSTWVVRHVARLLAAATLPVAAIAIFLPGAPHVRAWTAIAAGTCALFLTLPWINEATDHRLVRAGYDWQVGPELRAKRDEIAQLLRNW